MVSGDGDVIGGVKDVDLYCGLNMMVSRSQRPKQLVSVYAARVDSSINTKALNIDCSSTKSRGSHGKLLRRESAAKNQVPHLVKKQEERGAAQLGDVAHHAEPCKTLMTSLSVHFSCSVHVIFMTWH